MLSAKIIGKSGKEYFFEALGVGENCWPSNIFLYARLTKDGNTGRHEWVQENISNAKFKLCLTTYINEDKNVIVEDLKEDEFYKIKIDYIEK